jgi:hypothetical protein
MNALLRLAGLSTTQNKSKRRANQPNCKAEIDFTRKARRFVVKLRSYGSFCRILMHRRISLA